MIVVGSALAFDFTNGFHDTANVVAAAISTRALAPRTAVTMASALNFAGAFISLKVAATIANARAFLAVQREHGTFDRYIWSFVGGKTLVNRRRSLRQLPGRTAISDAMSADLRKRGFRFVGSTICYAYMQASGMVNDHLLTCPRHAACARRK